MFDIKDETRLQITAGVALLNNSKLLYWSDKKSCFRPVTEKTFEGHATKSLDRHFGRVMRWILFSSGAEFFLKGACMAHGFEIRDRTKKSVPDYPVPPFEHWAAQIRQNPLAAGAISTTNFGTLGSLRHNPKGVSYISQLAAATTQDPDQQELIRATFTLLAETIRNRDAHAYVPKMRQNHFRLVKELFVPTLNAIVEGLPGGPDMLEDWRKTNGHFIRNI